jgi:hypothetical protein
MRILIESKPKKEIPRDDLGDYFEQDGTLYIHMVETKDWRHEALVAFHEFVESLLLKHAGIPYAQVDLWDEDHEEKGDSLDAPYHAQHVAAENLERLFAQQLGVEWEDYEQALEDLEEV